MHLQNALIHLFLHSPKQGHWGISSLHCRFPLGAGAGVGGSAVGEGGEEGVHLSPATPDA